jgi:hypothetical protein
VSNLKPAEAGWFASIVRNSRFALRIVKGNKKPKGLDLRMRCSKTVSAKKIEANRRNGKHSTGPRTEGGKRNAKSKAVTFGLFAKHVVIPICDGDKAEKGFESLLDSVHGDFQPVGVYEEWLVLKITECMWRLRRATRCESGSVRELAVWDDHPDNDELILGLPTEIGTLTEAEEQLRNSGTLSHETYAQVPPLVEEDRQKQIQPEIDAKSIETHFDDRLFLSCITSRKKSLDSMYDVLTRIQGDQYAARSDHHALPPVEDMDTLYFGAQRHSPETMSSTSGCP